jgi:hypothetical protein
VTRRVEESDDLVAVVDLVRADCLRDTAGLLRGDFRLADGIEQRRLSVVDVAHDRDNGRARLEIGVGVLEGLLRRLFVGGVHDLDAALQLIPQHLDRLVGKRLRDGRHLPLLHQLLDHLGNSEPKMLGYVLDRRSGRNLYCRCLDNRGRRGPLGRLWRRRTAPAAATPALLRWRRRSLPPRCLRVDHDPAATRRRTGGPVTRWTRRTRSA